jgi:hypothetical protein
LSVVALKLVSGSISRSVGLEAMLRLRVLMLLQAAQGMAVLNEAHYALVQDPCYGTRDIAPCTGDAVHGCVQDWLSGER